MHRGLHRLGRDSLCLYLLHIFSMKFGATFDIILCSMWLFQQEKFGFFLLQFISKVCNGRRRTWPRAITSITISDFDIPLDLTIVLSPAFQRGQLFTLNCKLLLFHWIAVGNYGFMYINEKNHLVWIHFFSLAEWLYGYNNYRECTMNRFSFTFFSLSSFTDNVKYIKPSLWSKGAIAISYIVTIKPKIVAFEQLSCFLHTSIVNVKYVSSFTSEPWWFYERDTWRSHIL